MHTRPIEPRDFEPFDRLTRKSTFVGDPSAEQMRRFFELVTEEGANLVYLGAFVEGELAGLVSVTFGQSSYKLAPFAWCDDLYVDEGYRRRGVAQRLMRHLRQLAEERGCSNVLLGVGLAETGATQLYESLGFTDMGCRLMTWPIESA
ncbi:MAG: GNAT family N-acetyltransferase [Deltaproteobacteria bacterium]|nr:GNAT family N-acetyltransferase [Deltaproteobacteria bacterium]